MENNSESFQRILGQIQNVMISLCEAIIDVRDKINTDHLSEEERKAQVEELTRLAVGVEKISVAVSSVGDPTDLENFRF